MYSKYKFIRQFLFIFLFIFLLADALYLYDINKKVEANTKIKKMCIELVLLNKKLNNTFKNDLGQSAYVHFERNINRFRTILKKIRVKKELSDFFLDASNKELFLNIQRKFRQKTIILNNYRDNDEDAIEPIKKMLQISRIISTHNDPKDGYSQVDKDIDTINKYLVWLYFDKSITASHIQNINKRLLAKTTNQEAYNYFKQIDLILDKFAKTKADKLENEQINLHLSLIKLRERFENYSSNIIDNLYINMSICFSIIIFFIISVSFLLSSIQDKAKIMGQFQQAVQNSDNSVVITDIKHKILYVNDAFEKITGYSRDEVLGQTPAILQSGLHDKVFYQGVKEKIENTQSWTGEFSNRRKDGKIIYEKTSIYPMLDEKNKLNGYLGIKLDITEEKKYLREIENKNMEVLSRYQIDDATGLWSRNVLNDELARNMGGYLIYIKVKNFKDLRFFYGTKTANKIIIDIANKLKRFIYIYKINGSPFVIGEDDFCIWYKHKKPSVDLLDAISRFFSTPVEIEGTLQPIDIYMGISTDRNLIQGDRLWQSMIAFYKAEQINMPYVFYEIDNDLERNYRQNLITAKCIQDALDNELVIVECQPIFNTQTKDVYSFEVLVRLKDKDGKKIYPGQFLDIARQSLLYAPVMHNVIYLAFELIKSYPRTKFSINMSSSDMLDEDTSRIFLNLLESSEHPENVIIEILESESISNYGDIKPFLQQAKGLGAQLSIDDFGSGYSNYYRIMELDIDNIKIDGSIIKELPYNDDAKVVVETIVGFAKKKGYKIVAEFVSNDEIYEEVKKYGIEYTQGFYLGQPIELPIVKI